jgi:hypothetical protein
MPVIYSVLSMKRILADVEKVNYVEEGRSFMYHKRRQQVPSGSKIASL